MRKIGNKAMNAATNRIENGNSSGGIKDIFNFGNAPAKVEWAKFQAGQPALFDIVPYVIESKCDPDVVNAGLQVGDIAAFLNVNIHRLGPDGTSIACTKNFRKNAQCAACAQEQEEWDKYRAMNLTKGSEAAKEAAKIPKAFAAKMRTFLWIRPYEFRNGKYFALDKIQLMEVSPHYFTESVTSLINKKATFGTGNSGDVIANFSVSVNPLETTFGKALDFSTGMSLEPRTGPDITEAQEALAFSLSKYLKVTANAEIEAVMYGAEDAPEEESLPEHDAPLHNASSNPDPVSEDDVHIDFEDEKPASKPAEAPKAYTQPNKVSVSHLKFRDPCPINPSHSFGRHFDKKDECGNCPYRTECENAE